jgi:hypothetical protein
VKAGIIIGPAVQQKDAGLRRYGNFYFIGNLKTATAFETLLVDKDLDMTLQLFLIRLGQQPVERHISFDNRQPLGRKLLSRQSISPSFFESEHITLSPSANSFSFLYQIYARLTIFDFRFSI